MICITENKNIEEKSALLNRKSTDQSDCTYVQTHNINVYPLFSYNLCYQIFILNKPVLQCFKTRSSHCPCINGENAKACIVLDKSVLFIFLCLHKSIICRTGIH